MYRGRRLLCGATSAELYSAQGGTEMGKTITMISLATLLAVAAGCKSGRSVSRVYQTDMDTTWAAVLQVVEKLGTEKPAKVDDEKHKIVTGFIYGHVRPSLDSDTFAAEKTADVWRAMITCRPDGSGTKVKVRIQKASIEADDDPRIAGTRRVDVMPIVWTSDTEWQRKFLDDVEAELNRKQAADSPPEAQLPTDPASD